MELTARYIKQLKKIGHSLKPVVNIGKDDLSDAVKKTIEDELNNHELVKIKIQSSSSLTPDETAREIYELTGAKIIRSVGNTILLYRQNPDEDKRKITFK